VTSVQPTGAKNSHSPAAAALLSTGVYRASASRRCWWALTPPLHPYLCWDPSHRRYVSVALSSRFPALGFPQRCVLLKARTFLILLPGGGSEDATACPSYLFISILAHPPSAENLSAPRLRVAGQPACKADPAVPAPQGLHPP